MIVLAQNGVPWHEAEEWSQARRVAAIIAIGELDGRTFEWTTGRWLDA